MTDSFTRRVKFEQRWRGKMVRRQRQGWGCHKSRKTWATRSFKSQGRISPWRIWKEYVSTNTFQISDFQPQELWEIRFPLFKQLSSWSFVTTAQRNQDSTWTQPAPIKHSLDIGDSLQGAQPQEMQRETNKTHCYPWETLKGKKWGWDMSGKLHIHIKPHQIMLAAPQKVSPGG